MFTPHYQPKTRPKFINPSQIPIIVLRYPPNLPFQNCDCDPNPILQNPQEKKTPCSTVRERDVPLQIPMGKPPPFSQFDRNIKRQSMQYFTRTTHHRPKQLCPRYAYCPQALPVLPVC
ncbi:hypothetical protein HBH56_143250 [Parastagonospora nodorum]|uniref:Uncharacterized protein n=1 Tax=Phaeosphaeria nodorum (strain SN15 / ATCC MYA-4574 / FGSC 10173) TaxID=321614 RepID=A0A7U2FA46_PHANO|nr:hypothetical protein HBH56_143250 [Parastagonospora nodorum]QRD01502.1 hypothetical protein JI435_416810 [Parastagonospora nodorum SN15]KAH3927636.1 hypothetical protein HBH54_148440 [Parastagonospora nodorum]KAH4065239.1 hypothetical protein HBH50_163740 [Parastagonospora nodorum]KAH4084638.1 hypothetical protein HBH48_161470 [Parastagonospora nodorum]